jgi:hypothetical protein
MEKDPEKNEEKKLNSEKDDEIKVSDILEVFSENLSEFSKIMINLSRSGKSSTNQRK